MALADATESADLVLANDTDYPTRAALHSGQRNTTPDLTLSTAAYVKDWRCDPDAWGSDHYPLWITLNVGRKRAAGRTVRTIRWDAYRRAFAEQPKTSSVRERASRALRKATTETEVRADAPAPDIHMLNLWDARKRAQLTYEANGRRHRDRVRLRRRTAIARRYAKRLYRERWSQHCSSFNERTGLHKVWHTFKAMTGQRKTRSAISNVLLKTSQSVSQLQDDAANTFFPQPATPPNVDIYRKTPPVTDEGIQAPFSLFELEQALSSINARSAPGYDGVTWAALRNLEEYAKKQLLEEINEVWINGEIPAGWKHSIVTPIPKPNSQMYCRTCALYLSHLLRVSWRSEWP
ncbi:uncharacterized protein LOC142586407 [Dermacentor variabilis]|uniref:uncharacterized protein LOC142586407 n=1 Tax=Dermacentor variabilis TaxID=34621 RepID=UPI003F5B40F1